jgi:hypothetical protein
LATADEFDKTAEDGELERQLDRVANALQNGLKKEQVRVLCANARYIHDNDDQVDKNQFMHQFACDRLQ